MGGGLNSVPGFVLMGNSGIQIGYLNKIGIEVCYKKIKSTH